MTTLFYSLREACENLSYSIAHDMWYLNGILYEFTIRKSKHKKAFDRCDKTQLSQIVQKH